MTFIDHFSEKSDLYAAARPVYPDDLFGYVASIAPSRRRAWDCGTGNGQAAAGLARYFEQVAATDPSASQLAHATPSTRVAYSLSPAERTGFAAGSFDAVCVAQALHWFDLDRFYAEARRVLRPRGVLVVWGYSWFELTPDFEQQFRVSIMDRIARHWPPQNELLWNGYRDVPFPFERIAVPDLKITASWSFPEFLAFVRTWSGVRRCISAEGEGFFETAALALSPLWGPIEEVRSVTMPLHILAGRCIDARIASIRE